MAKRCLDIVVSLGAVLFFLPLFILVAIFVRINLGSPVLFLQMRPGLHGKPFFIYKFRSLTNAVDEQGALLPDEKRLTFFGNWLRKSSLDEIPQLFNVIKGDMSLVGPRPLLMEYLPLYSSEQARRHDVLPGITGWAQVCGRNAISWEEKFSLDVWYVEHQSFWLDLKILVKTVQRVFSRKGVNKDDASFSMEKFRGSTVELSNSDAEKNKL